MKITTIGIDLAKEVFQIHGVDERGKDLVRKQIKRKDLAQYFANLPPCLIGMEVCGSAHYWARKLGSYGHTAKLMAPQFVKPHMIQSWRHIKMAELDKLRVDLQYGDLHQRVLEINNFFTELK